MDDDSHGPSKERLWGSFLSDQKQQQLVYLQQHHHHHPNAATYLTTFGASLAAAGITYPAEQARIEWEQSTLNQWNYNNSKEEASKTTVAKSSRYIISRIITPLVRIWTNHVATSLLEHFITPEQQQQQQSIQTQLVSGTLAGVAQVAIMTPIQFYQSYRQHAMATKTASDWYARLAMHLFQGGSWDPEEHQKRVRRSIGLQASREILFNVTFFPLFNGLMKSQQQSTDMTNNKPSLPSLVSSGMIAGTISALVVTPLDLAQTFYRHSRQHWHWWNGLHVQGPPFLVLARGVFLHAVCLGGPTFGVVAAMYEYATTTNTLLECEG